MIYTRVRTDRKSILTKNILIPSENHFFPHLYDSGKELLKTSWRSLREIVSVDEMTRLRNLVNLSPHNARLMSFQLAFLHSSKSLHMVEPAANLRQISSNNVSSKQESCDIAETASSQSQTKVRRFKACWVVSNDPSDYSY